MIEKFVNDAERIDAYGIVTRLTLNTSIVADIKADDNSLACRGGLNIGKGDIACSGADNTQRNLVGLDFVERLDDSFKRALGIGLDDDIQFAATLGRHCVHESIERDGLGVGKSLFLALTRGLLGKRTSALFV